MRHSHHISIVVTLLVCITLPVHSEVRDSIEQALDEVLVSASRIDRRTIPAQSLDRTSLCTGNVMHTSKVTTMDM